MSNIFIFHKCLTFLGSRCWKDSNCLPVFLAGIILIQTFYTSQIFKLFWSAICLKVFKDVASGQYPLETSSKINADIACVLSRNPYDILAWLARYSPFQSSTIPNGLVSKNQ
ncbi:hypothetical protein ALO61_200022 [Pseudomonas savastanoi pv. nerii]|nr:hypothetical protein ALO61_200022 [Pseudomonas savastanoi pv. nerii]